jgi:uncharacterized protein YjiS (DUF1127 family)
MNQLTVTPTRIPAGTMTGSPLFAIVDYLSSIVLTLEAWRQREVNSTQLAHTDPRTLRDIGISESQQFIEANKSLWEK